MRYFNYLDNIRDFKEGYLICKQIIEDVLNIDASYLTEEEISIISSCKAELLLLDKELGTSYSPINKTILIDLLDEKAVNYCFKYNSYPSGCSKTGEKINIVFKKIFEIEDIVGRILASAWGRIVTPFEEIKNGQSFIVIGHSGSGYINLPESEYYKDNGNENVCNISCSVFTDKLMNCFNSKIVMLFNINPDSLVSVSSFDCATQMSLSKRSIKNLKEVSDNSFISAGYAPLDGNYQAVTKTKSPKTLIDGMLKNEHDLLTGHGVINEAILDKRFATAQGLLLFSSGYDILISEYIELLRMKKDYNLDFKVINRDLYREKYGLPPIDSTNTYYFYVEFNRLVDYVSQTDMSYSELESILDGYVNDVVIPLRLRPDLEQIQLEFIDKLKKKIKEKQSTYN